MIKRKQHRFKGGKIIDVEEYHDGRYGAPGCKREKKKNPTKEQIQKINAWNKARRCKWKLLEYFSPGDCFATWTYEVKNRPPDMAGALKDFQKAMRSVRKEYKKRGKELFWIRNIERGTKGAWHIHLIVNEIGETASILQRAWTKGGTWSIEIRNSKYYDEDFSKISSYMTKDEHTTDNGFLSSSIEKDYRRLTNIAIGYGKSVEELLYYKYPDAFYINERGKKVFYEKYRGISDIVNGASDGKVFLGYGHLRPGYWERENVLQKETFAQFGRILYDQDDDVLKMTEEIFENTSREVLERIKGMIK